MPDTLAVPEEDTVGVATCDPVSDPLAEGVAGLEGDPDSDGVTELEGACVIVVDGVPLGVCVCVADPVPVCVPVTDCVGDELRVPEALGDAVVLGL